MIYRARTMTLIPAKAAAVREVAVRAASYVNEHYPGIHVEILENISGPIDEIHMVTRCDSLAALEVYEEQRKTDAGWNALVVEVQTVAGATESGDRLFRAVT